MTLDELDTPFLTVDLHAVERNIRVMQGYCDDHAIALRPHIKTHKSPAIAELQLEAGAVGLTCQTLGEAELMVEHGCGEDILITFPLIGTRKAERFARLATKAHMAVGADSAAVARALSKALEASEVSAGFLVDCDTGAGRTGVQSPQAAVELAQLVAELPGLEFRGLMTHPTRVESGPWLREARRLVEAQGLEVSCISGGGTPAALTSHLVGGITELRVGSYVYRDRRTSGGSLSDCALRVRSTVVSTPTRDRAILDAGSKTLTNDLGLACHGATFGSIVEYEDAAVYQLSEEHGHVDVSRCDPRPQVGEVVTIIPNHACGTVNLHSEVALHRDGRGVRVVAVAGRGLVR